MKRFSFASKAALATVLLLMLLASDLLAGGITITSSRRTYQPTDQLSITFNCACPFPCGDPTGMDDIYLRRQSWTSAQMGLWYSLGNLRNGGPAPTTTTRNFPIPAGVPIANDYVITVWSGEANCSGDSAPFAIGQRHAPTPEAQTPEQPRPVAAFRVLQPGGSPSVPTAMGNNVPIVWESNPDRVRGGNVDILLVGPAGETYPIKTGVANNGRYNDWRVNYQHNGRPSSSPNFGSNFKIRVRKSSDQTLFGDSNPFQIPRPEIAISCPRVIRDGRAADWFFRGDTMNITWTSRYLDPRVNAELRTLCNHGRGGGWCGTTTGGDIIARLPATANRFTWPVGTTASGIGGSVLQSRCDPVDCRLRLVLEGTDIEFISSNSFSIVHH